MDSDPDDIPFDSDDEEEGTARPAWDANDERRRHDPMAPPMEPCECFCMHCRRTFMSNQIWFQRVRNPKDSVDGFWMCPTPNCDGAGFTFDIFPTDPNHPANDGWFDGPSSADRDWTDEEEEDDEAFDSVEFDPEELKETETEWDPDEPRYKQMDEFEFCDDEDLEGDEWKYGLQPGQRPSDAFSTGSIPGWDDDPLENEEEALYNQPDRRPREVEFNDPPLPPTPPAAWGEDEIPF